MGCSPAAPAAPDLVDLGAPAAPLAPRPAPHASCVVEGDGDPASSGDMPVFAAAAARVPVAVVRRADQFKVRFVQWPAKGPGARARVELGGDGYLTMSGYVDVADRRFQLAERVEIAPPHVVVRAGTVVEVLGWRDGGLEVRIRTPFGTRPAIERLVPCGAVAYGAASLARGLPPAEDAGLVKALEGDIVFFDAPGGRPVFRVTASADDPPFGVVGAEAGFLRVLAGSPPDRGAGGTLLVDAWVERGRTEPFTPSADRDSHGSILDEMDRCPGHTLDVATEVRVGSGPEGPVVGIVERGAAVDPGERRGGFVAFEFSDRKIEAPPRASFWIAAAALGPCGDGSDADDGCPCPDG